MRNINFNFIGYDNDYLKKIYSDIEIKYNEKDKCFYTLNGGGNGMLAIENSDIILNFDLETKRISGLDGYIGDLKLIQKEKLPAINSKKSGILYVSSNEIFSTGVAYEFKFDGNIKFDDVNKILIIGEFDDKNDTYNILKNVYIQLDKSLKCILIVL